MPPTPSRPKPSRRDAAAAVAHLRASDPVLAGAIDRCGPYVPRRDRVRNLFEALLRAIVYQ